MSDLIRRISSGEELEKILSDLYYGIESEQSDFLNNLLERIRFVVEAEMKKRSKIGLNNSPEPIMIMLPFTGSFFFILQYIYFS